MKAKERVFNNVTEQRRKTMSKIRGKNTTIEVTLQKALWAKGYRYRKNYKKLPGSPDICLTKYRIAIFCDSEFFIYNKETNFYKLWDYCYEENAIRDGDLIVDKYIKDNKLRQKWDKFCVKQKNDEHKMDMNSAHNTFNILGEIQFGNWAMVYKDMFRLVSAINKNAQIDLYIYIAATDNLKKIISDGVVGVNAARERFQENIDNHNINKPVMIVPLDIDFDLDTYDFSEAEKGYDEISREIQELEQKISWNKKKITVLNDKKKNADSEKAKIIKEEIKDLRNEKKHNQQELDELKNLYKISDEIEEI